MSNIGVYKLVTGELIVGKVREQLEPADYILIDTPLAIHVMQSPDRKSYQIGMLPYNPVNPEGTEKVYKHAVVSASVEVPKQLVDAYIQQTSGIEIATSLVGVK